MDDSRVSGWTLLFCGQKVAKKAPGFQEILRFLSCLRRLRRAQKKLADRAIQAFGPCQLSWLKQFFAFPASTRLRQDKNRDFLKASPVGDDRE